MRFSMLGSLTVIDDDGNRVTPAGPRQKVLLAALLLHANTPVSAEALAEAVWDASPPPAAVETLRSYIKRLRRALGVSVGARIAAHHPGYLVRLAEQEFDVLQFEAHCRDTGTAVRAADWAEASAAAQRATDLWRGEPLLDVPSQSLRSEFSPRLEQLRMQLQEDGIEAGLQLGLHDQLVPQLRDLTAQHPLRERFHAQLMLALARAGRRAEALDAYRHARTILVDQLGIEPGPELRDLHERVLNGEHGPAAAAIAPAQADAASLVPRQLPTPVRHFAGRQAELDVLTRLPDEADASGDTVLISAIDGMAGVGKTALAVHAAYRLAEKFPDGQLFLDLHGYTQDQRPRTAHEALAWLLRALGMSPERIPADDEQAAALYRQRLAGTRTLIVLDNAADEAQVRPLLPGGTSCLVVVTSRRRLKGLDDAHTLSLDLLSPPHAVALLRAVAGGDRFPPDDRLAGAIAGLCGYLPLALRLAASLLRHRPAWPPEHLAEQLRDQHQRVASLNDGERELAAVFDLSYTSLEAPHRQLWRRLGLVPGPDLNAYAAAALVESDPMSAAGMLEDLVDHNLLITYAPGRYRLHDLLRAHAHTLASTDPEPEREAAVDRLLRYYAYTAQNASAPITRCLRPEPDGPAPAHTPAVTDPDTARAWLRTEQPNLDAAFTHAHAHDLDEHAIALAAGLAEILRTDGPFTRALEIQQTAAETAERTGRPAAQAHALTDLGLIRRQTGDYSGAEQTLTLALDTYRALGRPDGEANALTELGRLRYLTGDYPGAEQDLTRALDIYRASGHRRGEANAQAELGPVLALIGNYPGSDDALTHALELYRAIGHRDGEAYALTNRGLVRRQTGDYSGAERDLTRALDTYRTLGHRLGEANALTNLGRVRYLSDDYRGADEALNDAVEIYRTLGYRDGEAYALIELGLVRRQTEDYPAADDAITQGLEIFRALTNRYGEAYALTELGRVRYLAGNYPGADKALTQAMELFRAIGMRDCEAVALNYYAATLAATGRRTRALALYEQALAVHRELNKPDDEAVSLEGIAEHHLATGDPGQGIPHLNQALDIYKRLGTAPDARRVQRRLDGLTAQ
jgi:DNA-binding SARP family transcriptional activator